MNETTYSFPDIQSSLDHSIVRLRGIQWLKVESGHKLEQQFSGSYILIVVSSGGGRLMLDHKKPQLQPDTAYLCPPRRTYGAMASAEGLEMYLFRFELLYETKGHKASIGSSENGDLFSGLDELPVYPPGRLAILCRAVYEQWFSQEKLKTFRSQIDFQELIYFIATHSSFSGGNSSSALERSKDYMETHFQERITIETLAGIANLSPKYYVDLFKKKYGSSAMEFLSEVRIKNAKRFMLQNNGRVKDIAEQVGFRDEFYFSRKFKKEVGISPSDYIKRPYAKVAAYGHAAIGQLLTLGIMPYVAPLHPKWTKYYYEHYQSEIPVCLSAYLRNVDWKENVARLLEARPDVVIATGQLYENEKELIRQGVPLFLSLSDEDDWRTQFRTLAAFLGEEEAAEHCLGLYEHKTARALERLKPYEHETVMVIRMMKKRMHIHCGRSVQEVLYGDLKRRPWSMEAYKSTPIDLEGIRSANPDRILALICQESETLAYWNELQNDLEWQQIEAVRHKHVHMIFSDTWREYSIHAHMRAIDAVLALYSGDNP